MKTAFITSLIGIGFGIYISRFIQGDVEKNSKTNLNEQFKNISRNSNDISDSLKEIAKSNEINFSVADAIQALKESVEKSSSGVLVSELSYLSTAMERYIDAAENQTRAIAQLGDNLNKSSAEQIARLNSMDELLKR